MLDVRAEACGDGPLFDTPFEISRNRQSVASRVRAVVQCRRGMIRRQTNEEACICNSFDRLTSLGTNEIGTQEYDHARRQLRADWPHCEWHPRLFDEVR
jgi:hypothetical protein